MPRGRVVGWFWSTDEWQTYEEARQSRSFTLEDLDPVTEPSWVIDLRPELSQLKEGLSKGHKASIAHGLWYLDVVEFTNTTWMRATHERAAGRVTRPLETWNLMNRWMESDNGLCLATYGSDRIRPLCWAYFIRYQDGAYYMSAATEPDLPRSSSANHVLMWEAIKRLHSWGYQWLELGPSFTEGIGAFKKSFGARLVGLGERVGDSEYVHAPLSERGVSSVGVETPA